MSVKTVQLSNLAIPPGEHLQEEVEYRGISLESLAEGLGLSIQAVEEIFCGERPMTPRTASAVESFLGIPASLWLNMEARYRLTLANNLEVYGYANPFDGPESGWPEVEPELEEQAVLPE